MSPLIDVTNTLIVTEGWNDLDTPAVSLKPSITKSQRSGRHSKKKQSKKKTTKVPIESNKCSEPSYSSVGHCDKCIVSNCRCPNAAVRLNKDNLVKQESRVPPLPQSPEELLSQAVEALKLTPITRSISHPKKGSDKRKKQVCSTSASKSVPSQNRSVLVKSSDQPQDNKLKESVPASPIQCIACGLEFTSANTLTPHLSKHILEGLYAAQWLTEAMTLIPNNQSTDTLQPTSPVQTQSNTTHLSY